jgi:hypothetical protein
MNARRMHAPPHPERRRARQPADWRSAPMPPRAAVAAIVVLALAASGGCGVTRTSDSKRTATEQLMTSSAIERAVARIDSRPLAGRRVFLDASFMDDVGDGKYLVSTLRHQLLASGCLLADKAENADVIVEARAGAIGTDRSDLVLGMPGTTVSIKGNEFTTPDVAIAKRSEQRGVAKVSLHAYERESGRAVWQSGMENMASHVRDRWLFGAGPFQDGEIHDAPEFAGHRLKKTKWGWQQDDEYDTPDGKVVGVDLSQPYVYAPAAAAPPGDPARTSEAVADKRPASLPPVR